MITDLALPEQFLHRPDVVAVFQQMRRERATKNVRTDAFGETRPAPGLRNDYLQDVCGVAGSSLTPAEIGPALSARNARVPVELVTSVLTTCELARYAPADALPSAEACRQVLEQAEQVLASGR